MVSEKRGRNDPCLCGTGRKFKKCCLPKRVFSSPGMDLAWQNLRALEGKIIDAHLLPFVEEELPEDVERAAFDLMFSEEFPEELDKDHFYDQFFMPWFLFAWIPQEDFGLSDFLPDRPLALTYLKKYEKRLSPREQDFIKTACAAPHSFFQILDVEFEKSLLLRDIFLNREVSVKERLATQRLKRGQIIYTRVITLEDQSIMMGTAPIALPPHLLMDVVQMKQKWLRLYRKRKITLDFLKDSLGSLLRKYFLTLVEDLYTSPLPILLNTDGEPIEFHHLSFNLDLSLEEAFERLKDLTLMEEADIWEDAILTPAGEVIDLHFPWQKAGNPEIKSWTNTILGEIHLTPGSLRLRVNSANRARKGREVLFERLGSKASLDNVVVETLEQMAQKSSLEDSDVMTQQEKILDLPGIRHQLEAMARDQWRGWLDEKIPALNHQTPRQAAKTKKGRELLEALLMSYERDAQSENPTIAMFAPDIEFLRCELGLASQEPMPPLRPPGTVLH